jgi:hypothetical protein
VQPVLQAKVCLSRGQSENLFRGLSLTAFEPKRSFGGFTRLAYRL